MVVKDTRIVKKAAPERTPLRRVCNSPRSENKLSSKAIEVLVEGSKENKPVATGLSPAPVQEPHYLLPTINSCSQTRVNAKPLASPSVNSRVRKSSQSEACKYGSRNVQGNSLLTPDVSKRVKINGLRPSGAVEKTPMKIDWLKPSMAAEKKKPVKNNRFKSSGAVEKTQVENHRLKSSMAVEKTPVKNNRLKPSMSIEKTPGRALGSKIKVARATCSSRCKHVVKEGDSKVSPKPCCSYAYCSLNHLEHETPPSVKQFLASRRRLLRTQKSFKWVGLTPVPKSVEILDDGAETKNGVDTGQGLGADVLELCVEIYVNDDIKGNDTSVGGNDSCDKFVGDMNDLGKLSGTDPRPIAYESMECADYDDGHSTVDGSFFGSSASQEDDRIEILEGQFDLSDLEVKADVSIEQLTETEFVKDDDYGLDADVSACDDEAGCWGEHDQTKDTEDHCSILPDAMGSQSDFDESDLGVTEDDSTKEFAGVEDVKEENHVLDVEASTHDLKASYCDEYSESEDNEGHCLIPPDALLSQCNFDESDLRVKEDDSMKQFAEVEVVNDDNHGLDVDASVPDVQADETEDVEDHCFIPPTAQGPQYQFDELDFSVKADDSMEQLAEAEVVKDDKHRLDVYALIHDVEADEIEDSEDQCFIPSDARGSQCQSDAPVPDVQADETEDVEDHCFIPPTAQGPQYQFDELDFSVKADDSMEQLAEAEVVKDDKHRLDVYALIHDVEADETEDSEDQCFIPSDAQGSQCQVDEVDIKVEADDSVKQFAEAEVVKDVNHGMDVYASVHDGEADETGDGEDLCFIQPDSQGPQCQFDEVDIKVEVDDSVKQFAEAEADDPVKQFAEAEVVKDVNHELDVYASVHDGEVDETGDGEDHCFIPPDAQGPQCQFDEVGIKVEGDDSIKQFTEAEVVKDVNHGEDVYASVHDGEADETGDGEDHCLIPPNAQGPQSQFHKLHLRVKVDDSMKQYAEAEDVNDDNHVDDSAYDVESSHGSECRESRCFIPPNAPGSQCISHLDSDGLPSEFDSYLEGEVKEEHNTISGIWVYEITVNDDTQQFIDFKDDKGSNGGSGSDIEPSASPEQEIEMKCTNIAGNPLIELYINISDDHLFRELSEIEDGEGDCKSGIDVLANESVGCNSSKCSNNRDNESHCSIQVDSPEIRSTEQTVSDSPVDKFSFELSARPEYDMIEDCSNIAESSLEGLVAGCESIEGDLKEYNHIVQENVNKNPVADSRIFWRRRNALHLADQLSEAEKVDLRHQMMDERRAAHEWMLDYALTQVVKKLSPFRKRKVELLVEAFETVTPIPKCEANDLKHDTVGFAHLRPMQACG